LVTHAAHQLLVEDVEPKVAHEKPNVFSNALAKRPQVDPEL
jgi:hypothetical protein